MRSALMCFTAAFGLDVCVGVIGLNRSFRLRREGASHAATLAGAVARAVYGLAGIYVFQKFFGQ